MNKQIHFTAIFSFSDIIAWKCWAYLCQKGLRVPEDVSIIGFDYIHSRLELPFQVTSISSHKRHMSTTAVDILVAAIHSTSSRKEEQIVIDTTLSEGQTVHKRNSV